MLINGGRGMKVSGGSRGRQPLMGPMDYKTYTIRPRFRAATCAEVDCEHFRDGWTFSVALLEADKELNYMARHSGKKFQERMHEGQAYLVYAPGQPCFASRTHRIRLEEATPLMFVGRGDPRTFDPKRNLPPDARQHTRTEDWVDDFATHQDKLNDAIKEG